MVLQLATSDQFNQDVHYFHMGKASDSCFSRGFYCGINPNKKMKGLKNQLY